MNGEAGVFPKAKKSLGQNFLHDRALAARIVEALAITPADRVLEIGPGRGALTGYIRQAAPALFIALEKDRALAFRQNDVEGMAVQVVLGDALQFPWERLQGCEGKGWKVIGNLPYNIASPLMWELFSRCQSLARAVFMVQKEVGERLTAAPGTRAYGALSVWVRSFVHARLCLDVPAGAFSPRPKVDSAVLGFTPLALPRRFDRIRLAELLHVCFQQRRKQLGRILRGSWNAQVEALLETRGFSRQSRPEELPPAVFQELSGIWTPG